MSVIKVSTYSPSLQIKTDVNVILPGPVSGMPLEDAYRDPRKYPVLYLLHGTYGNHDDWLRYSRIESYAQEYHIAVVMMDAGNSYFRDVPRGQKYFTFITEEVPRMVEWMFPISGKREDKFVAGLSMGGFGACKIAMKCPDRYSHAACLSSAFDGYAHEDTAKWPEGSPWEMYYRPDEVLTGNDEDLYYLVRDNLKNNREMPKLYIAEGLQDFLMDQNERFTAFLSQNGIPYTYHKMDGAHDWSFWDAEIKNVLEWLPIEKNTAKYGFH